MLVRPLPGVTAETVLAAVSEALGTIEDARTSRQGAVYQPPLDYARWASETAAKLRNVITVGDIERLIFTPAYGRVLSQVGNGTFGPAVTLVDYAIDTTRHALEEVVAALDKWHHRWFLNQAEIVVPDTGFYINTPCPPDVTTFDLRQHVNFPSLVDAWDKVHIIIPMVVIDELDGLKESRTNHVRWRAGHTLGVFDEMFTGTRLHGRLRGPDVVQQGPVSVWRHEISAEIILDPRGHIRLPKEDDEVIDRAVVVQSLSGRSVTLLTFDTGQAMRARQAGLQVLKLDRPKEDDAADGGQPAAPPRGRRSRSQRARNDAPPTRDPQSSTHPTPAAL